MYLHTPDIHACIPTIVISLLPLILFFFLECGQFQSYQSMLHYHYSPLNPANEFHMICTHEYLLRLCNPLFR